MRLARRSKTHPMNGSTTDRSCAPLTGRSSVREAMMHAGIPSLRKAPEKLPTCLKIAPCATARALVVWGYDDKRGTRADADHAIRHGGDDHLLHPRGSDQVPDRRLRVR